MAGMNLTGGAEAQRKIKVLMNTIGKIHKEELVKQSYNANVGNQALESLRVQYEQIINDYQTETNLKFGEFKNANSILRQENDRLNKLAQELNVQNAQFRAIVTQSQDTIESLSNQIAEFDNVEIDAGRFTSLFSDNLNETARNRFFRNPEFIMKQLFDTFLMYDESNLLNIFVMQPQECSNYIRNQLGVNLKDAVKLLPVSLHSMLNDISMGIYQRSDAGGILNQFAGDVGGSLPSSFMYRIPGDLFDKRELVTTDIFSEEAIAFMKDMIQFANLVERT